MTSKRLVILESPFAALKNRTVENNIAYAKLAMMDSLSRNEAPIASHLLYPQILNDNLHADRALGIAAGHAWLRVCDEIAFYADWGFSPGMCATMVLVQELGLHHDVRYILPMSER